MLHTTKDRQETQASVLPAIKILLVIDQKIVQHELEQILSSIASLQIVRIAHNKDEAISMSKSLKPDVMLIDLELVEINCVELTLIVERRFSECKVLVLSNNKNLQHIQELILTGVDGYIFKDDVAEKLLTAIGSVYKGCVYFETELLRKIIANTNSTYIKSTEAESSSPKEAKPKIKSNILSVAEKKYRFKTKWLMWSGLGMAIAIGGWWGYNHYLRQSSEPVPVEMHSVEKGTVEITVSESGKLELGGQQTIKSPQESATVEKVNVTQGEKFEAGEPLIVLRDRDTQEQEQDQKLENEKSSLTLLKNGKQVAETRKKVIKETALVRESAELLQEGYIAESELEEDREQLEAAKSELSDAELEFNSAKLDLQHGQAKLANIQQKLHDRSITSSINGVVLDVGVKDGDGITTDTKLLTVGDPEREIVKLQLTTLNASKVKLNQPTRISVIGPNAQVYTGKVTALSPQATTESLNSDNESSSSSDGSPRVDATVLLDKPSKTIIPGSQVNVEIVSQQRQNVVTLPLEMLQNDGDGAFVWVKDKQNQAKKQPVTLGLEDLSSVEITSGLQAGDRIILPPADADLVPGDPLHTESDLLK